MTPKEQYEARKANRDAIKKRIANAEANREADVALMIGMVERFVHAVERIADALEKPNG